MFQLYQKVSSLSDPLIILFYPLSLSGKSEKVDSLHVPAIKFIG